MMAHTRQFPTIPTTTNMESTVVIATPADPNMMGECQRTYLVIWISKQNDNTRNHSAVWVNTGYSHQFKFYIITKSMRALWLADQLWVIVPVNLRKNRAFSELLYKSNRPQVSMGYRLINHAVCWLNTGRIRVALVRALAGDIMLCSWARHFTLTVPLFTLMYKCGATEHNAWGGGG